MEEEKNHVTNSIKNSKENEIINVFVLIPDSLVARPAVVLTSRQIDDNQFTTEFAKRRRSLCLEQLQYEKRVTAARSLVETRGRRGSVK